MGALQTKTNSMYFQKKHGWEIALSRESIVLMDVYDAIVSLIAGLAGSSKPQFYPRGYDAAEIKTPKEKKLTAEQRAKLANPEITKKTPEEIREANAEFIKRQGLT